MESAAKIQIFFFQTKRYDNIFIQKKRTAEAILFRVIL